MNGELRGVSRVERRISEAIRLGFKSCLMPKLSPIIAREVKQSLHSVDMHLIEVGSMAEALRLGLIRESKVKNAEGKNTSEE